MLTHEDATLTINNKISSDLLTLKQEHNKLSMKIVTSNNDMKVEIVQRIFEIACVNNDINLINEILYEANDLTEIIEHINKNYYAMINIRIHVHIFFAIVSTSLTNHLSCESRVFNKFYLNIVDNLDHPSVKFLINDDDIIFKKFLVFFLLHDGFVTDNGISILLKQGPFLLYYVIACNNLDKFKIILSLPGFSEYIETENINNNRSILEYSYLHDMPEYVELLIRKGANFKRILTNYKLTKREKSYNILIRYAKELVINDASNNKDLLPVIRNNFLSTYVNIGNYLYALREAKCHDFTFEFNNDLRDFDDFFNKIYNWLECKSINWALQFLVLRMNGISKGQGILRTVADKYFKLLLNGCDLISPIFEPCTYKVFDNKINNVFRTDIDNCYMYIPYYDEPLTEKQCNDYLNFGIMLALAFLFNSTNIHLSVIIYKFLADETIELNDFLPSYIINELHNMDKYTEKEFENLYMNMTINYVNSKNEIKTRELVENGNDIPLSKNNFSTYKNELLNFYLTHGQRDLALTCIKNGFTKIIKNTVSSVILYNLINAEKKRFSTIDWIKYSNIYNTSQYDDRNIDKKNIQIPDVLLTEHITSDLICSINVNLKKYNSVSKEIVWFFQILHELDDNEYHKLVKFICGSDVLPVDNLKIAYDADCTFTIIKRELKNFLPTSYTCTRSIHINSYDSKEIEKTALLFAINECNTLMLG